MDHRQTDPRRIAAEAVGERPQSAIPAAVKEEMRKSPGNAAAQAAAPAGPQASLAAKTAEALGERAGGAYADATMEEAQRRSQELTRRASGDAGSYASMASRWVEQQPLMTALAAFGLGYAAALLIHRRP